MFLHHGSFRISTKVVVFNAERSAVLLIKLNANKRGENVYGLPGGHLESIDRTPEEGLLREFREEVDAAASLRSIHLKDAFFYNEKRMILLYLATVDEASLRFYAHNANEDNDTPVWLPLDKLNDIEISQLYLEHIRSEM